MFKQFEVANVNQTEGEKNSEGDIQYKIYYDNRPVTCKWCNCSIRADSLLRHEKSKKHLKNREKKYKIVTNGREYIYDKSSRKSMKERMKDPVNKKKHYNILKKKVACDKCATIVAYSSMWRHKASMKCKTFIE
jgi:hypothetical protein